MTTKAMLAMMMTMILRATNAPTIPNGNTYSNVSQSSSYSINDDIIDTIVRNFILLFNRRAVSVGGGQCHLNLYKRVQLSHD